MKYPVRESLTSISEWTFAGERRRHDDREKKDRERESGRKGDITGPRQRRSDAVGRSEIPNYHVSQANMYNSPGPGTRLLEVRDLINLGCFWRL